MSLDRGKVTENRAFSQEKCLGWNRLDCFSTQFVWLDAPRVLLRLLLSVSQEVVNLVRGFHSVNNAMYHRSTAVDKTTGCENLV
jgi:hypothetical protein